MAKFRPGTLEGHFEALAERAVRIEKDRKQRIADRKARDLAELRATGMIVPDTGGPFADILRALNKDKEKSFRWW